MSWKEMINKTIEEIREEIIKEDESVKYNNISWDNLRIILDKAISLTAERIFAELDKTIRLWMVNLDTEIGGQMTPERARDRKKAQYSTLEQLSDNLKELKSRYLVTVSEKGVNIPRIKKLEHSKEDR